MDLYECLAEDIRHKHKYTTYDLISNVIHDGKPQTSNQKADISGTKSGSYRVQIIHNVCF